MTTSFTIIVHINTKPMRKKNENQKQHIKVVAIYSKIQ